MQIKQCPVLLTVLPNHLLIHDKLMDPCSFPTGKVQTSHQSGIFELYCQPVAGPKVWILIEANTFELEERIR